MVQTEATPVRRAYEWLADDVVDEGVDTVFGLMGDGNMKWMCTIGARVDVVYARHESAALAMADGWARASGRVGVASVTCGPGLTQLGTSLTVAARHRTPIVVLAGDTPTGHRYHLQRFDAEPFVVSTGALCDQVGTIDELETAIGRAFAQARTERLPVVLSVPYDLQDLHHERAAGVARRSDELAVPAAHPTVQPEQLRDVADRLRAARRPLVVAGAGAIASGCRDELLALADKIDAGVGTTVRAKGWFEGERRDLGIVGGLSSDATRKRALEADVVLAVGASLSAETVDGGALFANVPIVQVAVDPIGAVDGHRIADVHLVADAREAVTGLLAALADAPNYPAPERKPAAPQPILVTSVDNAGVFWDPASTVSALGAWLPAHWPVAVGAGHFWNWLATDLAGRAADRYQFFYDFGAIAQGLAGAIGMSYAHGREPVVAFEGDGSALMNVQEWETLARHRIPVLLVVVNDGAYGAEYHKLLVAGIDPAPSCFGWPDFAAIAAAFGLRGRRPETPDELAALIEEFAADPVPTVVDLRVDPRVAHPHYRRVFYADR